MRFFFKRSAAAILAAIIIISGISVPASASSVTTGGGIAASGSAITGSAIVVTRAEITSAEAGENSVKVKIAHKKTGKITGYCVYKKRSGGRWVLKVKNKKKGSFTYEDKNVSYKKTYKYRARAYYKAGNGKIHYGKYTPAVKVKIRVHKEKKYINDKNSALYGKTLILYKYGNGKTVEDPTKYVKIKADKYELYVNKARQYVTAYAVKGKNLIPVKSFICSPGWATPTGEFTILAQFRWRELMGPCWGQWCSRLTNDGIYFHSIFSSEKDSNNTMSVSAYNNLGTTCSHGCIRIQAGSAKWIYDNCKVGTKVYIYNKTGYEPFTKPKIEKLPYWHTWDPTDPTAAKYCKEHKCHQKK